MIDIENLDDEQKSILQTFAKNVDDCTAMERADHELLKWLVARNFDLKEAEKMFRLSYTWRQANQVDDILKWTPPEVFEKYYSMGSSGYDKHGCAVWICAYGQMDMKGIMKSVSKKDYLRFVIYCAERTKTMRIKRDGVNSTIQSQEIFIVDMDQLNMDQLSYRPVRDVGIETTRMTQANYPEGTRRVFIINVPQVFTIMWSLIKPFLHQVTIDKVHIYGTNTEEWKAALLEEIDADQLPAYYGGTLTDPDGDPRCPSKIGIGGKVPKSYYIETIKPEPTDNMSELVMHQGSKTKFEFEITNYTTQLKWCFMTDNADIGFRIFYKNKAGEEVAVLCNQRVDSHVTMEEGAILCNNQCSYVFEFDNSYSYFRSKKVWYSLNLVESDGKELEQAF